MIELKETHVEYLLFIPASQRDRAKAIYGRKWDVDRKAWVYPRTSKNYQALLTEFADDLIKIEVSPPEVLGQNTATQSLEDENKELRGKLDEISKAISALASEKGQDQASKVLIQQIETLNRKIESQDEELKKSQRTAIESNAEANRLKEELSVAREQIQSKTGGSVEDKILARAYASTGNDKDFKLTLERMSLDSSFPIEFCKVLENYLRNMLKTKDREIGLYELLVQAKDAEIMSEEALDLAHSIRRQRNTMAHHQIDNRTRSMRVLYVLTAVSLLWPHLSQDLQLTMPWSGTFFPLRAARSIAKRSSWQAFGR